MMEEHGKASEVTLEVEARVAAEAALLEPGQTLRVSRHAPEWAVGGTALDIEREVGRCRFVFAPHEGNLPGIEGALDEGEHGERVGIRVCDVRLNARLVHTMVHVRAADHVYGICCAATRRELDTSGEGRES